MQCMVVMQYAYTEHWIALIRPLTGQQVSCHCRVRVLDVAEILTALGVVTTTTCILCNIYNYGQYIYFIALNWM